MSDNFDDFFGQGEFVPTAKFTNDTGPEGRTQVGGKIVGEILSMAKQDQKDFVTGDPIPDGKGGNKQELKVVLQTEYRNWDKVAKVPEDDDKKPMADSEDDGRRAIYVRGWMIGAIGDAVKKATGNPGGPKVGGKLGVKVTELVDTTKGNPFPKYEAVYTPPAASDGFFEESQAAAPAQATTPTPAQETLQSAAGQVDEPPF